MSAGQPSDTDKSLRVLIVGGDRSLEEEFRNALSRVPDRQGVIHFAETYREAVEIATRRQPTFILIEIDRDVGEVAALSKDLQELAPESAIAGAFNPDRLEQGQSESATIIELLRAQVRDFLRRPLSTTELRAVLDRLFSRLPGAAPVAQGRVSAFLSNKGGVGKSTLSVRSGIPMTSCSSIRRCRSGPARCCWICSPPPASSMRSASEIALIRRSCAI